MEGRRYQYIGSSLRVGLKPQGIEIDGFVHPFFAELTSMERGRNKPPGGLPRDGTYLGINDRLATREDLGSFNQMQIAEDSGAGYILFDDVTEGYTIRSGVQMIGKTAT